jgi:hypothetical protein
MQSACAMSLWLPWFCHIFPHYFIKGALSVNKAIEHKTGVLILSTNLFETFLILRRNERDIIINVLRSSLIVPIILVRFRQNLNYLHKFLKSIKIPNFMKICSIGAGSFHADRHKDRQTERDRKRDKKTYTRQR